MQFYDIKEVQCRYTTFWFIMILIAWHDKHHASASFVSHRCVCRRRLWTVLNQVSLRTVFSAPLNTDSFYNKPDLKTVSYW